MSNLERAVLDKANLKDAKLQSSNLKGAELVKADLRGTFLSGTIHKNLKEPYSAFTISYLGEADLNGADLKWVHFEGANFLMNQKR